MSPRASSGGPDGVLAVDKPVGPTSHDVVARARRSLGTRRIGHTGTLDPFASGLLLLCVGAWTRLAEYLTARPKTYEATALLGVSTDTLDPEGEVVARSEAWRDLGSGDIEAALTTLRGPLAQVPPQYSAKKVDGVAMHRRARAGETVALEPRAVTVHELELTGLELPEVRFRVRCSSGTYVRALARDLGEALGTGAHLTALRRTAVGDVGVEGAVSAGRLDDAEAVAGAWIPPLEALGHLDRIEVDADGEALLAHGRALPDPRAGAATVDADPLVLSRDGRLLAIAEARDGRLQPRKVFVSPGPQAPGGGGA